MYFSCGRPYNQIEAGDGTLNRNDATTHTLNRTGNSLSKTPRALKFSNHPLKGQMSWSVIKGEHAQVSPYQLSLRLLPFSYVQHVQNAYGVKI